jgi:hypothetical protein
MASQCIIAFPKPVKLSSRFANDLNEAEQATLSKPIVQFEETTITRLFPEKRTLSNSSSTSSNATTLVDKEHEQGELPQTQTRPFCDDGNRAESHLVKISVLTVLGDSPLETPYTRLKQLVSTISFPKAEPQAEKEAFVKERCKNNSP